MEVVRPSPILTIKWSGPYACSQCLHTNKKSKRGPGRAAGDCEGGSCYGSGNALGRPVVKRGAEACDWRSRIWRPTLWGAHDTCRFRSLAYETDEDRPVCREPVVRSRLGWFDGRHPATRRCWRLRTACTRWLTDRQVRVHGIKFSCAIARVAKQHKFDVAMAPEACLFSEYGALEVKYQWAQALLT